MQDSSSNPDIVPNNGTYEGKIESAEGWIMEVHLRFNTDLKIASADFFEEDEYYASMRSKFNKSKNIWKANSPRFILDCEYESYLAGSLKLNALSAYIFEVTCVIPDQYGVEYIGTVSLKSDFYRTLDIELDKLKGLTWPTKFTTDDIPDDEQPIDLVIQDLDIASVFGKAGIEAIIHKSHTSLPWDSGQNSGMAWEDRWDERELHEMMDAYYSRNLKKREWWLYLLLVSRFDGGPLTTPDGSIYFTNDDLLINAGEGVFGFMFDYKLGHIKDPWANFEDWLSIHHPDIKSDFNLKGIMRTGSFYNERPRQGAAVFVDEIMESALIDSEWHRNRSLLRTIVHELGHALNVPHSFDCGRSDTTSIMNYPTSYPHGTDITERAISYWKDFDYSFDPEEVYHLHHGFFNEVVPGGLFNYANWTPSSVFYNKFNPTSMSINQVIDIKPTKRIFRFTEPVTVEIMVLNKSKKPIPIGRLSPSFGNVRFVIKSPNGSIKYYRPPVYKSEIPKGMLKENERKTHLTSLAVGAGGLTFDTPGRYEIFAVATDLSSGNLSISNVEPVVVQYPDNDDEKIADLIFDRQAALFLYLGGGEHLNKGKTALENIIDKYKQHPTSVHANLVLGLNKCSGQKHALTGKVTKSNHKEGLEFLRSAVESALENDKYIFLNPKSIKRLIETIEFCQNGWEQTKYGPRRLKP